MYAYREDKNKYGFTITVELNFTPDINNFIVNFS